MHPWSHLDALDARWRTAVQQHPISARTKPGEMTAVRVAGLPPKDTHEVKRIASLMEIAAWIHRVSTVGPTEEWDPKA